MQFKAFWCELITQEAVVSHFSPRARTGLGCPSSTSNLQHMRIKDVYLHLRPLPIYPVNQLFLILTQKRMCSGAFCSEPRQRVCGRTLSINGTALTPAGPPGQREPFKSSFVSTANTLADSFFINRKLMR